ncbi:MAG: IS4 family transposase [Planctomycetaceae bacterium]|nr:IS4 family transposase [Planctomycetaceae bacterium]
MSSYKILQGMARPFSAILRAIHLDAGLPFAKVLSEADIQRAFDDADCHFAENEDDIFTPSLTLWAFLSQMLFAGAARSCNAAAIRVRDFLLSQGKPTCSSRSGAYCKARDKIDEAVPVQLIRNVANQSEQKARKSWLWNGRKHVYLVDGAEVTGADTPENQAAYPQPDTQLPGCGFPMMRIVVLTSLITAMVRGIAVGPYSGKETGESALFRKVAEDIPQGSVVVGDRYYCSYFAIAMLLKKGIDVVTRLTNKRLEALGNRDTFKRMKNGDLLVTWKRPQRPDWMSREEYETMPETLTLRLVEVHVAEKGFRTRHLHVVTTLLDAKRDTSESLSELYRKRWHVELDLNAIKTMMGLDILRGKSPHMMRLELLVGLLAYNLVRLMMLNSASLAMVSPRSISFTTCLGYLALNWNHVHWMPLEVWRSQIEINLLELAKHRVGHRPGRLEPRQLKRRLKAYNQLQLPRAHARKRLLKNQRKH